MKGQQKIRGENFLPFILLLLATCVRFWWNQVLESNDLTTGTAQESFRHVRNIKCHMLCIIDDLHNITWKNKLIYIFMIISLLYKNKTVFISHFLYSKWYLHHRFLLLSQHLSGDGPPPPRYLAPWYVHVCIYMYIICTYILQYVF